RLGVRDAAKVHGRVARLEEDPLAVVPVERRAVEDVLEVQPRHLRHEEVCRLRAMRETPQTVVARAGPSRRRVVADDRSQIAGTEGVAGHGSPRCTMPNSRMPNEGRMSKAEGSLGRSVGIRPLSSAFSLDAFCPIFIMIVSDSGKERAWV